MKDDNTGKESKRGEFIDKMAHKLKEWDKEIEKYEEIARNKKVGLQKEINKKITNLKSRREELHQKMERFEEASEEASQKIRRDLEKLWKDIEKSFKKIKKDLKK